MGNYWVWDGEHAAGTGDAFYGEKQGDKRQNFATL